MGIPNPVQVTTEGRFFRDFVDNSDMRLGNALLTEDGRTAFNEVMFEIRYELKQIFKDLPSERDKKLLTMAMIKHAVSQILSEIAQDQDR